MSEKFTWGEVVTTHTISTIKLIEYHPRIVVECTVTSKIDYSKTAFFSPEYSESWDGLDAAIIGSLCHKYQGPNSHLAYPIMRMLEMKGGSDE
jgi:hypothetical protein